MRLWLVVAASAGLAGCVADPTDYAANPYRTGSGPGPGPVYGGPAYGSPSPYDGGYGDPGYAGSYPGAGYAQPYGVDPVIVPQVGIGIGFGGRERYDGDHFRRERFERDRFEREQARGRFEPRPSERQRFEPGRFEPGRGRPEFDRAAVRPPGPVAVSPPPRQPTPDPRGGPLGRPHLPWDR